MVVARDSHFRSFYIFMCNLSLLAFLSRRFSRNVFGYKQYSACNNFVDICLALEAIRIFLTYRYVTTISPKTSSSRKYAQILDSNCDLGPHRNSTNRLPNVHFALPTSRRTEICDSIKLDFHSKHVYHMA